MDDRRRDVDIDCFVVVGSTNAHRAVLVVLCFIAAAENGAQNAALSRTLGILLIECVERSQDQSC